MARPKNLDDYPLEADVMLRPENFEKAYKGKIDSRGRIPTVGYPGQEVLIFIKKKDKT
jgi:hypothetical protein